MQSNEGYGNQMQHQNNGERSESSTIPPQKRPILQNAITKPTKIRIEIQTKIKDMLSDQPEYKRKQKNPDLNN